MLVLHAQHIFANSLNFLVTWGLLVTVFHSMCIFCVYIMALYWPTLQFHVCMCHLFAGMWCPLVSVNWIRRYICDYFSSSSVVSQDSSALCMYLKFRHHPHPLSHLCAKFRFFHSVHCWASPGRTIAYSITLTQLIWCPRKWSLHSGKATKTNTQCDHRLRFQAWKQVGTELLRITAV